MKTEMIFSLQTGAFTFNRVTSVGPEILDYSSTLGQNKNPMEVDESGVYSDYRRERFKFVTIHGDGITFSEYSDYKFMDWRKSTQDLSGYDYSSYIITGPIVGDNFALYKQSNYLSTFFDRTEKEYLATTEGIVLSYPSGCVIQGLWDWHGDDALWSRNNNSFKGYKLRHPLPEFGNQVGSITYPEDVIITKNKLRGRGRSLSLKFSSEEGKDMKLIGWHLPITQVDKV